LAPEEAEEAAAATATLAPLAQQEASLRTREARCAGARIVLEGASTTQARQGRSRAASERASVAAVNDAVWRKARDFLCLCSRIQAGFARSQRSLLYDIFEHCEVEAVGVVGVRSSSHSRAPTRSPCSRLVPFLAAARAMASTDASAAEVEDPGKLIAVIGDGAYTMRQQREATASGGGGAARAADTAANGWRGGGRGGRGLGRG